MEVETYKFVVGLIFFLLIIFGITGNVISFIIWLRGERCRTFPVSVYLVALSVADTAVLLSATDYAYKYLTQIDYVLYTRGFFCKLIPTFWHFTILVSTWIVVCMTVDRVIAVTWPFKAARWASKRRSMIVIGVVVCVCFLPNLPWTVAYKVLPLRDSSSMQPDKTKSNLSALLDDIYEQRNNLGKQNEFWSVEEMLEVTTSNSTVNGRESITWTNDTNSVTKAGSNETKGEACQRDPDSFLYKYNLEWHYWFVDFILVLIAPVFIIIISDIIILRKMRQQRKRFETSNSGRHLKTNTAGSRSITARVIAVSLVHIITVGSGGIVSLIPVLGANVWVKVFSTLLWYVNYGCNFVLYSFIGTDFRRDLKGLLCKRRRPVIYQREESASGAKTESTAG